MFKRVDSDTVDKLIEKEENTVSKLDDKQKEDLKPIIERNIEKEKFTVVFENLSEDEVPFQVTQPEFMRRMKDMSEIGGGYMGLGNLPGMYNLVVNTNNNLTGKILEAKEDNNQDQLVKQLYDLALLSQNLLKGEKLTNFVKRSIDMIDN
jgi:molecular chaperone HtpG